MKNKILKILLSSMMVSLSAPVIPTAYEESIDNSTVTIQNEEIIHKDKKEEWEDINKEIEIVVEEMNHKLDEINNIQDTREWFVSYKDLIDFYSYVLDPPETIYDYYTDDELDLLFKVVQAEVGDEYSFEQKVNIASIVFNRIEHEGFPDNMFNVLSEDQFQVIGDGRYEEVEVSIETILACEYCFMFGDTTNGCLFFDSNGKLNYEFVYFDGAHNFYK